MSDLVARAYQTAHGWLALGHERIDLARAKLVRDHVTPNVYDANFAAAVRAERPHEIDSLLADIERVFAGFGHRHVLWDPETPQPFEARLLLDGWRIQNDLVTLVLEGELHERGQEVSLRAVESDADWQVIEALHWLDHQEEVTMGFHEAWERSVTEELVASKRRKSPAVRYFLAQADGIDCAFFSAWPGENGVGQIEDLFTRAEFRGRGIAKGLIAACIDDARARGASEVLVNARTSDTPKQMYAALGFRPLCVQRSYLKQVV
jgi:GNAT superfamily N-acetyltransferase